jgi:hypothetical protein
MTGFMLRAQTPEQIYSAQPAVEGWTKPAEYEVFHRDNLYDRINGSAPLFLEFNFEEMTALLLNSKANDDYITIQVYRHATPQDAFGMYASERSSDLSYFDIGIEAQGDNTNMYFVTGSLYIKMWVSGSFGEENQLQEYAAKFSDQLQQSVEYPEMFRVFPDAYKVQRTETYITSSYIGHSFLKNVYAVNYEQEGKQYQMFIIDAKNTDTAREMLNKYYEFTKQPANIEEGFMIIEDRYNVSIPLYWKGRFMMGIMGETPEGMNTEQVLSTYMQDAVKSF